MTLKVPAVPRCLASLVLLLLALLLLIAAVVLPWQERNSHYDEALEEQSGQLVRLRRLIATIPGYQARLQEIRGNRELDAYYLKGNNPSLAGVDLQRRIEHMVEAAGGQLISIQILPMEDKGSVQKIGVRVRMSGDPGNLGKVLYEAESGNPLLFVSSMTVRASRQGRRPPKGVRANALNVNLDVYGYIRKGPA